MTERSFRLVIGVWLVLAQLFALPAAGYALVGVLLFEGVTNLRVPLLMARLGRRPSPAVISSDVECLIPFEAERALRLLVASLLAISFFVLPDLLWWLPWFIGFAMIGAGLSGLCPMVHALRWIGMR